MSRITILLLFVLFQFNSAAQSSALNDDLNIAYNNFDITFDRIKEGQTAISYCYSIKNKSQLRTQILYACGEPAKARQNIDNAINQVYKVEQLLQEMKCPLASSYAKYSREMFESAKSNLRLGVLAFISASEQRNLRSIYANMNVGVPHWASSLKDLNKAVEYINKISEALNSCNESQTETSSSSEYSCDEIYNYIKDNGSKKATISSYTLNSSWLNEVVAYSYDNAIYVVAEIKVNENSDKMNKYIFCGIPDRNWSSFQNDSSETYGERFHNYIFNYKCDCE